MRKLICECGEEIILVGKHITICSKCGREHGGK